MLADSLQTTPYITCVRPNEPLPIVYMTDTLGPEYPRMTAPPAGTEFGVIGLDRDVVWRNDATALVALESAARKPVATQELTARFGHPLISDLVANGWLQDPSQLCREYVLRTGQIEVTAHCNWGCRFCPVATDPKPRETMPLDLFEEIIAKLAPFPDIRYVTFHFFNEPTLDPLFAERIEILRKYGTKLSLATNCSALIQKKIDLLRESGVVHHLVVNLPSSSEDEFRQLTGSRHHSASVRNLESAIEAGFPITIAVNGIGPDVVGRLRVLRDRYEPLGVEVNAPLTCDRAGTIQGTYHQDIHVRGRLRGCSWPVNHAYFSVRGDMFICCNDYYQREIFGHVRDGSIHEVMTSSAAVKLRRRVFGVEEAPVDYICRTCHDQELDFAHRQFRPLATFPVIGAPQRDTVTIHER
jgi:MoaA/NifB/PqqE/SkfB family radical SAM enzyme